MSKNKKIILFAVIVLFFSFLFLSTVSFAGDYGLETARITAELPKVIAGEKTIYAIVGKIIGAVLSLIGIVFFGLTLYSGLYWMTARGDSAKVDKAKNTLESAAIGLVIVISAYAIVNFIFTQLYIN